MDLFVPLLRPELVSVRVAARTETGILCGQVTGGDRSTLLERLRRPRGVDLPEVSRHVPFEFTKRHRTLGHGGHVARFTCEVPLDRGQRVGLDGTPTISVAALALRPQSTLVRLVTKPSGLMGIMAGDALEFL